CGTTSYDEISYAQSLGMEVVVIDHHLPRPQDKPLPCPLVNPSQPGEDFPHKSVCAAGLSYLFVRDLQENLLQSGHGAQPARDIEGAALVAAAIGTITDVMRLDNPVNRYIVKKG